MSILIQIHQRLDGDVERSLRTTIKLTTVSISIQLTAVSANPAALKPTSPIDILPPLKDSVGEVKKH
ncbi:MAG: hypothetical protein R6X34_25860 [Chloroflexota bacterium]